MKQFNNFSFTDPVLKKLIALYPKPSFKDRSGFLYENLIESIISQQLSVKAADTIYGRFLALFSRAQIPEVQSQPTSEVGIEVKIFPMPQQILAMSDEKIRTAGISFQKISYIKSVADAFLSGLIDTKKIKNMSDEEVIAALTQIRGVGRWTAEMTLIFTLNRPDVFSLGDLGLRNAITKLYGITDQKKMLQLSEKWKPYRSTACWYLWRSLENK